MVPEIMFSISLMSHAIFSGLPINRVILFPIIAMVADQEVRHDCVEHGSSDRGMHKEVKHN